MEFAGNLDGFLWRVDHWAGHYQSWQLVHNLFVAPQLGAWEVALKTWCESCKLALLPRYFRHHNLGIIVEDQVKHRKESVSVYNYGIVLLCSFSDIRHTHCQFCFQHSELTKPFRNKNVPISRLFPQLSTITTRWIWRGTCPSPWDLSPSSPPRTPHQTSNAAWYAYSMLGPKSSQFTSWQNTIFINDILQTLSEVKQFEHYPKILKAWQSMLQK